MQFKLDENLPPPVADLLRGLGHDVWIADEHRIRVRQVGEIDLGPEVDEVPFP